MNKKNPVNLSHNRLTKNFKFWYSVEFLNCYRPISRDVCTWEKVIRTLKFHLSWGRSCCMNKSWENFHHVSIWTLYAFANDLKSCSPNENNFIYWTLSDQILSYTSNSVIWNFETKLVDFYCFRFLDDCLHYYIHNISADMSSSLLQAVCWILEPTWSFKPLPLFNPRGGRLFWFH